MPRIIETTVYKFDELSPKAKEKAREWWRSLENESFGSHGEIFEPAETAAKLLGITFDRNDVPLMGGSKRSEPVIYWGLHVQGSGASFEGRYDYKADCLDAIKKEFPTDLKLHGVADVLRMYGCGHTAKCDCSGARYPHSGWMNVSVYDDTTGDEIKGEVLRGALREFADWIYRVIDEDFTYRMSDENVNSALTDYATEYEFEADGTFHA